MSSYSSGINYQSNLAGGTSGGGYRFVLPGNKYIGPGNPMPPSQIAYYTKEWYAKNPYDALAFKHDQDYGHYLAQGKDPYWNFNQSDERLLAATKELVKQKGLTMEPAIMLGAFGIKEFSHKLGIIPRID